jgi:hypothetical protein
MGPTYNVMDGFFQESTALQSYNSLWNTNCESVQIVIFWYLRCCHDMEAIHLCVIGNHDHSRGPVSEEQSTA